MIFHRTYVEEGGARGDLKKNSLLGGVGWGGPKAGGRGGAPRCAKHPRDRRTPISQWRTNLPVVRERDIKGLQGSDGGLRAKGTFEDPTGVFWAKVIKSDKIATGREGGRAR